MITLMYDGEEELFDNPYQALTRVKDLEEKGYMVDWMCTDPYLNDCMWENY